MTVHPLVHAVLAISCLAMATLGRAQQPAARVAPLFSYGSGQVASSVDGTNDPVCLSEEEARGVIAAEALAAGITFTESLEARALSLDGTDPSRRISFIFVSRTDANAWRRKATPDGLTQCIDLRECASTLRDRVTVSAPTGTYAIFYDPAITPADVLPQLSESARTTTDLVMAAHDLAIEALRQQVRDFLIWNNA